MPTPRNTPKHPLRPTYGRYRRYYLPRSPARPAGATATVTPATGTVPDTGAGSTPTATTDPPASGTAVGPVWSCCQCRPPRGRAPPRTPPVAGPSSPHPSRSGDAPNDDTRGWGRNPAGYGRSGPKARRAVKHPNHSPPFPDSRQTAARTVRVKATHHSATAHTIALTRTVRAATITRRGRRENPPPPRPTPSRTTTRGAPPTHPTPAQQPAGPLPQAPHHPPLGQHETSGREARQPENVRVGSSPGHARPDMLVWSAQVPPGQQIRGQRPQPAGQ